MDVLGRAKIIVGAQKGGEEQAHVVAHYRKQSERSDRKRLPAFGTANRSGRPRFYYFGNLSAHNVY